MIKNVLFPLLLVASNCSSKPAGLKIFHFLNFLEDYATVDNQIDRQRKLKTNAPFQGKKSFCSYGSSTKYIVTIKKDSVLIISDKTKIRGVFRGKKLLTDDPGEVEYRRLAGKYNCGRYYVIGADYFSVLNAENGEYRYYTLCK